MPYGMRSRRGRRDCVGSERAARLSSDCDDRSICSRAYCSAGAAAVATSSPPIPSACNAARVAGTCDNRLRIARTEIDRRVLRALREELLDPSLFEDFCEAFTEEVNRHRRTQRAALAHAKRKLADVEREIKTIVQAVSGFASKAMAAELADLERREEDLTRALSMPAPPFLHPQMATLYRQQIAALCDGLSPNLEADQTAVARLRGLVDRLTIQSDGGIVVEGNLAAMLALAHGKTAQAEELSSVIKVVAGARNRCKLLAWWVAA